MTFITQRCCQILAVSALAFGLAACGKTEDTAGQKLDSAVQQSQQAAQSAGQKIDNAMSSAGTKIEEGAAKAEAATNNAMSQAGAALDDAGITAQIKADLIKEPDISAIKIDVDTKAGAVTLTGSVPSEALKMRAGDIAKSVKGVNNVSNMLEIKAS